MFLKQCRDTRTLAQGAERTTAIAQCTDNLKDLKGSQPSVDTDSIVIDSDWEANLDITKMSTGRVQTLKQFVSRAPMSSLLAKGMLVIYFV